MNIFFLSIVLGIPMYSQLHSVRGRVKVFQINVSLISRLEDCACPEESGVSREY